MTALFCLIFRDKEFKRVYTGRPLGMLRLLKKELAAKQGFFRRCYLLQMSDLEFAQTLVSEYSRRCEFAFETPKTLRDFLKWGQRLGVIRIIKEKKDEDHRTQD